LVDHYARQIAPDKTRGTGDKDAHFKSRSFERREHILLTFMAQHFANLRGYGRRREKAFFGGR
jgi:hypothetical protein